MNNVNYPKGTSGRRWDRNTKAGGASLDYYSIAVPRRYYSGDASTRCRAYLEASARTQARHDGLNGTTAITGYAEGSSVGLMMPRIS
ncbi:hypothetical protein SCLCIDRAFT_1207967 [Scleroderma citrinum Foug A]|uniref:Uncharacterized protein n=1 Tax=Scleroderma citrinum Foug A TaxID=1036808 RepID=A0A0C3ENU1_9AGAM|nr:hypothetical protein SCLCIDRAFT_1207967 [Scleroderma citrinum Foug A]